MRMRVVGWVLSGVLCVLALGCAKATPGGSSDVDAGGSGGTGGSAGSGGGSGGVGGDAIDAGEDDAMVSLDSGDAGDASAPVCPPVVALHESLGGAHVASNEGVVYNSNPPSSGPHCGVWGRYDVYGQAKPLPRCNYIHNLEHGAVVLLYRCDGDCPEIVAALSGVRDQIVDAECTASKRVILSPDPELDTLVAAAAWRTTWKSDCVDDDALTSLTDFINDNLGGAGLAPESGVCGNGSVTP